MKSLLIFALLLTFTIFSIIFVENAFKDSSLSLSTLKSDEIIFIGNNLKAINLEDLDRPLHIIFFNSTCDYCQVEAEEVSKNYSFDLNFDILMISNEDINEITQFSKDYNLSNSEGLYIGKYTNEDLAVELGVSSVPFSILLNKDGKIIKKYQKPVKLTAVIKSFNF